MELLINIIAITATLTIFFGGFTLAIAWEYGGQFYIKGNKGRRKCWVERLLDGMETLRKM